MSHLIKIKGIEWECVKRPFNNFFPLNCRIGLDLINGKPQDNKQAGVFEPTIVKVKSLKFATEAAITILRIDDLIKLHPESKDDKHGGYEDAVHSGALDDWSDFFYL